MIPLDQRSYAQRWAVQEGMRNGILPEGTTSEEPNVDSTRVLEEKPDGIHVNPDGRLNVEDVTVWLFLQMTQPEEREGTRYWFWYLACLMFAQ